MKNNAVTGIKHRPRHDVADTSLVVLYGRSGCPMCADAEQWLQEQSIPFSFREIFVHPLSQDELRALGKKTPAGIHDLYAPKGARKVGLPEDGRALTPDQIVGLQVGNPDLIRYPLFELNDQLLFGFHQATRDVLMTFSGEHEWPTKSQSPTRNGKPNSRPSNIR